MKTMVRILATALTFGVAVLVPAGSAPAAEKAGDVVSVRGKATIERRVLKAEAQVRSILFESDTVVTQDRSRIKMLFRDDSILTLGSKSKLVIRKYLFSPEGKRNETIYELADGRLRSVVGSPGFKVMTPTAFAAARGTILHTSYNIETGTTEIAVLEGEAEVRNANADVKGVQIVKAGQATTVTGKQPPTKPRPLEKGYREADEQERAESGLDVGLLLFEPEERGGTQKGILNQIGPKAGLWRNLSPPIEQIPGSNATNVKLNVTFQP